MEEIKLIDLPEFAIEEMQGQHESVAPADKIGFMVEGIEYEQNEDGLFELLLTIYRQNNEILRHIDGIEKAFNEVAKLTSETLGEFANSGMGSMLGKLMGR